MEKHRKKTALKKKEKETKGRPAAQKKNNK